MGQGIARTRRGDHLIHGPGSLMDACLAVGLPVASSCFGRGACGKCMMTVLSGEALLPPPSERESAVLKRNQAEASQRLGCQCAMPSGPGQVIVTTGYW